MARRRRRQRGCRCWFTSAAPASQSGHLREPNLALTRPWSPTGFGSRQVTRFAQIASSPLPHCSARARRLTRQLCTRSTPLSRTASQATRTLSLRSDGRKLARQSKAFVRAQRPPRPRCSAYRPRPAIRREASPAAEDKAIARETSSGPDIGINREHGQLPVAPQAALPNLADLTDKTKLV
jgi:hypothetical protein